MSSASGISSRLLDLELDREVLFGLLGSNVCASASGLVCALGVADQSLVIGAIEVCMGGGELGLVESFFSPALSSGGDTTMMSAACEGVGVERRNEGGDCR